MEQLETKESTGNSFGLSKKTNIALAGIAAIATAKDSWQAVVAISIVVLICVGLQYRIDIEKEC